MIAVSGKPTISFPHWDQSFVDHTPAVSLRQPTVLRVADGRRRSMPPTASLPVVSHDGRLYQNVTGTFSQMGTDVLRSDFEIGDVEKHRHAKLRHQRPHVHRVRTKTDDDEHIYCNDICGKPLPIDPTLLEILPLKSATVGIRADRSPTSTRPRIADHPAAVAARVDHAPSRLLQLANDPQVRTALHRLQESGFYFGSISPSDARRLLESRPPGTFLVRASSDSGHLFSLSVRTTNDPPGVTSVRIVYERPAAGNGVFRLDGDPQRGLDRLPSFPCVVQLIRHHVHRADASTISRKSPTTGFYVFLERTGARCGTGVLETPVILRRPLPVDNRPPSLKHLTRLAINGTLDGRSVDRLQLVPSLKTFLKDYPSDF